MIKKIMIVMLFVGMNKVNAGWQNIEQQEQRLSALAQQVPHVAVNSRQGIARDLFGVQEMTVDDLLRDKHGNVHEDDQMKLFIEDLAQRGLQLVVNSNQDGGNFFVVKDNGHVIEILAQDAKNILSMNRNNEDQIQEAVINAEIRSSNVIETRMVEKELNCLDREARAERMRQERLNSLNPNIHKEHEDWWM